MRLQTYSEGVVYKKLNQQSRADTLNGQKLTKRRMRGVACETMYFLGTTELFSEALLYILIMLVFSGHVFCPLYEVILISEVENVLFLWQSQSGAHCLLLYGGSLYLGESVFHCTHISGSCNSRICISPPPTITIDIPTDHYPLCMHIG